jgi:hypothetical protein
MRPQSTFFNTAELDAFDARTAAVQDPRLHPSLPLLTSASRRIARPGW